MSKNILATRINPTLATRLENLRINLLAHAGGDPYIAERLSRWPSESDVDFHGCAGRDSNAYRFTDAGSTATSGRLARAFLNNYARRIVEKINQYVFQTSATRAGIDPTWAMDVTRTGMSLNQFMSSVSSLLTVCRWCWIGIDRPPTQGVRSKAQVESSGDRVYWQLYNPTEVVDWRFDARGQLQWILIERDEYDNSDPRAEATQSTVRYLYEPGGYTRMVFDDKKEAFTSTDSGRVGFAGIPFTLVGMPSADPWWFDDVERIQRSIMDLHSSLDTSIFKTIYPVMVVSEGFASSIKNSKIVATNDDESAASNLARQKIGTGNPIVESAEESGITRWLTGTASDLPFIRTEIDRRQGDLYDIVGLAMNTPESRQVASAESKQWDHLDTEAVLAERATVLEEAETKCIEMSIKIGGPIFTPYHADYAKKFDITDFASDIQSITTATAGLDMPRAAEKMLLKSALRSSAKRFNVPNVELDAALKAVDAYEPALPTYTPQDFNDPGNQNQPPA